MGAAESSEQAEGQSLSSPVSWRSRLVRFNPDDDELMRQTIPDTFEFALEDNLSVAKEVLEDERIALLRYRLVPSQMDEAQVRPTFCPAHPSLISSCRCTQAMRPCGAGRRCVRDSGPRR